MQNDCTRRGPMIDRNKKSFAESGVCHLSGRVRDAAACLVSEPLDFSANVNPPRMTITPRRPIPSEMEKLGQYPGIGYRIQGFSEGCGSFC